MRLPLIFKEYQVIKMKFVRYKGPSFYTQPKTIYILNTEATVAVVGRVPDR